MHAADLKSGGDRVIVAAGSFALAPDGKSIAFIEHSREAGTAVLSVVPVAGGLARTIMQFEKGHRLVPMIRWVSSTRLVSDAGSRSANSQPPSASRSKAAYPWRSTKNPWQRESGHPSRRPPYRIRGGRDGLPGVGSGQFLEAMMVWRFSLRRHSAWVGSLSAGAGVESLDDRKDRAWAAVVLRPPSLTRWLDRLRDLSRSRARVLGRRAHRGWHSGPGWPTQRARTHQPRLRPLLLLGRARDDARVAGAEADRGPERDGLHRGWSGGARRPDQTTLANALASFVRSILSGNSRFDRFVHGDRAALTSQEQLGLAIFRGKGNCSACHLGPTLTDERFHNTGIAAPAFAIPGGSQSPATMPTAALKTPTLRDIELTAPYMHDGGLSTLEAVVEFYDQGGRGSPT